MTEIGESSEIREICPIIFGLNVVSRKWILPIICQLNRRPTMRYLELKREVEGVTNMALTQALKELVANDLVSRIQFNEIPPHVEYSLTDEGRQLLPSLYRLAQWGLNKMDKLDIHCSCSDRCYAAHHEYIPPEKEQEISTYPQKYNERYVRYFNEIQEQYASASPLVKLEHFLLAMLRTLTEDGQTDPKWSLTYFFRDDTPNILQSDRPQYTIIQSLIEEAKACGLIRLSIADDYLVDNISKIVTGAIAEWSLAKCAYDIVENNREFIHWFCDNLQRV